MIDIKALEDSEYLTRYKNSLSGRGDDPAQVDIALELNRSRKKAQAELDECKAYQNKIGKEIAQAKKNKEAADDKIAAMQEVAQKAKALEHEVSKLGEDVKQAVEILPNICHPSVPVGKSEADNEIVRTWGEAKELPFQAKEHFDLGENLGILDFERAGKVTGARFTFLKGGAARLERALISFMMDLHSMEHGYEEMIPPFIVNNHSLYGTSQFPKFYGDVFHVESSADASDDQSGKQDVVTYHLVPTAEVPVTNYFANEILPDSDLPKSFVAYTPCFRSEAGSYGKDTRGLIRQHQFNKVELVKFTRPEESEAAHEQLLGHAEKVLQMLELPYRVSNLCTGDIGFGATKCYDIEVWLPGQKKFREISSCSNFGDFQARRANIRFRPGPKEKPQFVHTLNGSGLAVGRTLIAIIENFQREDGSINVPAALLPYTRGMAEIR